MYHIVVLLVVLILSGIHSQEEDVSNDLSGHNSNKINQESMDLLEKSLQEKYEDLQGKASSSATESDDLRAFPEPEPESEGEGEGEIIEPIGEGEQEPIGEPWGSSEGEPISVSEGGWETPTKTPTKTTTTTPTQTTSPINEDYNDYYDYDYTDDYADGNGGLCPRDTIPSRLFKIQKSLKKIREKIERNDFKSEQEFKDLVKQFKINVNKVRRMGIYLAVHSNI